MFHNIPQPILDRMHHREVLQPMLDNKAQDDQRIDALIVPIGKGELVCRKL